MDELPDLLPVQLDGRGLAGSDGTETAAVGEGERHLEAARAVIPHFALVRRGVALELLPAQCARLFGSEATLRVAAPLVGVAGRYDDGAAVRPDQVIEAPLGRCGTVVRTAVGAQAEVHDRLTTEFSRLREDVVHRFQ